jgi:hypothetical protein
MGLMLWVNVGDLYRNRQRIASIYLPHSLDEFLRCFFESQSLITRSFHLLSPFLARPRNQEPFQPNTVRKFRGVSGRN